MWSIYKLTNIKNNKSYIGQTVREPEERWKEHRSHANTDSTPLARAIKKYGWDSFKTEVIDTAQTAEEADEKEKYWIEYYKTCIQVYGREAGYNITPGGEGVIRITEEQRELMLKLWHEHYNLTEISNIMQTDRHTVRNILSEKGVPDEEFLNSKTNHYRVIYEYDKKGKLLNIFYSLKELLDNHPSFSSTSVRKVLNHEFSYAYNLIFLYEEDQDKLIEHILRCNRRHTGRIKAIHLPTGQETIYQSMREAERKTGISRQTIRRYIRDEVIKNNIKWEDVD